MTPTPHRIGRLSAEIGVFDLDTALKLRARAEDLVWTLAPRVITRVLDALVPADVHLALGRLELDLGVVAAEHLERDGLVALERALIRALTDALRRPRPGTLGEAGPMSANQARLDHLEFYLTRGVIPSRTPGAAFDPAADLAHLARHAPEALVTRLRSWAGRREALERLAIQGGEAGLRALAEAMAPGRADALLDGLGDMAHAWRSLAPPSLTAPSRRGVLWRSVLAFLLSRSGGAVSRSAFLAYLRDVSDTPAVVLAAAIASPDRATPPAWRDINGRSPRGAEIEAWRTAAPATASGRPDDQRPEARPYQVSAGPTGEPGQEIETLESATTPEGHVNGEAVAFSWPGGEPEVGGETGPDPEDEGVQTPLDLIERDPASFATHVRALVNADRDEAFALARRLLEILPPEAILAALLPGEAVGADVAAWSTDHPTGAEAAENWEGTIAAALLGEAVPEVGSRPALGARFDRVAAMRQALDAGAPPAGGSTAAALIEALPDGPWTDLWLTFAGADPDRIEARLSRALEFLPTDSRQRLLARLTADEGAPGAEVLVAAGQGADTRESVGLDRDVHDARASDAESRRARASNAAPPSPIAAATSPADSRVGHGLTGAEGDQGNDAHPPEAGSADAVADETWRLTARRVARRWAGPAGLAGTPITVVAPTPQDQAAVAAADGADAERAATLAWLSGAGPDRPLGAEAMRRLKDWAEGADTGLDAALRRGAPEPDTRARWAAGLTDPLLARLLQRLAPARAARLITLMTLLSAATRLAPTPGACAGSLRLPWAQVLGLVATPRPPQLGELAATMALGLAGPGGPAGAALLLDKARRLARSGGHPEALAALWAAARLTSRAAEVQATGSRARTRAETGPLPPASGEAIYVANAGLVLFNPYLPAFFDRLGLLTEGEDGIRRVRGLAAASRAVHLLQYLVDGRLDQPEPDLALNKALAGLVPAAPVTPRIEPEAADLILCDSLVEAVIANWPMMRGASPDALRETFLRREGRLTREGGRWALRVQRRSLDLIVDRIPWAISVVYHRWMTDPIHVTW